MSKKKLILASASPRRKELLTQIGIVPEIHPADINEDTTPDDPKEVVRVLAEKKCEAVSEQIAAGSTGEDSVFVLAADTIVCVNGEVLGKPSDEKDAARMIRMLAGRTHEVCTGVCIRRLSGQKTAERVSFVETTLVSVGEISEEEISRYIATGEPMDKAGAYGIQGRFAKYIDRISGDYSNVVGLPVYAVYHALKGMGYEL